MLTRSFFMPHFEYLIIEYKFLVLLASGMMAAERPVKESGGIINKATQPGFVKNTSN